MAKKKFTLTVEYHTAPNDDLDEVVQSITSNENCDGSGYGFGDRDHTFSFTNQKDFANALMEVAKLIKSGMFLDVKTGLSLED